MKLKYELEPMALEDAIVCVAVGDGAEAMSGVLKVNASGYEIVKLLASDTTAEAVTDALAAQYTGTPREEIAGHVSATIAALRAQGLIED